jgi:hypothetical protein
MRDKATLHTEEHQEKANEQGAVRTCNPDAHARAARSNGTVLPLTHEDRSVEIIWRPSTTREVQTICSVPSTCIKLVRYTERGRALDRAAKQMVQCSEEDRACRLGEPKRDLPHYLLRELIAELEKDKGTSGEQLLIRHMVSFRQKYTYRPLF